jgi:hypothetical protein
MKTVSVVGLLFIKFAFVPNAQLLFWMGIAIALDFCTGLAKACVLKQARTSSGFRKTLIKFMQYGGTIGVGMILGNAAQQNSMTEVEGLLKYFNDALVIFIICTEVKSIFENLNEVDNKSVFARYFIQPIHALLSLRIKNNPLAKQAEEETKKDQATNS